MNDKQVEIYSYHKVWNIEKKIYSFQNITLPVPVNPYDLLEFAVVLAVVLLLGKILPFVNNIPAVLRLVAIPYFITQFLTKQKLDGKTPVKFFGGCIIYLATIRGNVLERLNKCPGKARPIKLSWDCGMGYLGK